MSILSDLFAFLKKLIAKIVDIVKKALPYIMIGLAIWALLSGVPLDFGALASWLSWIPTLPAGPLTALLAIGTSFIVAPDETAEVLGGAVEAVGDVAAEVLETVVEVGASVAESLFSSPLLLLALGAGLLFFFAKKRDEDKGTTVNLGGPALPNENGRA